MDFKQFNQKQASEAGHTFNVVHPSTGLPDKNVWIKVRGAMSDRIRQFNDDAQKASASKAKAAKRRDEEYRPSQSEIDQLLVERCEATIIEWGGFKFDGKDVPFPSEKATEIIQNNEWLRNQILAKSLDEANFTQSLAQS